MKGQTNCALCEYRSRSIGSLKQPMESKYKFFNMTIVQVWTQQVERVYGLKNEMKIKKKLIVKAEIDLVATKKDLNKEKSILKEKENYLDDLIKSHEQKAVKEAMLIEELKLTKKRTYCQINELDAELKK